MIRAAKLDELTLKKAVLPFIAATPKIASGAADTISYLLRISKHSSTKSVWAREYVEHFMLNRYYRYPLESQTEVIYD
jgi:hypothetical protein